jgi:hypothetical protein
MPKRADSIVLLPDARSKGEYAFDLALTLTLELPPNASWDGRACGIDVARAWCVRPGARQVQPPRRISHG